MKKRWVYNSVSLAAREIGCHATLIHEAIKIIKKGVSRLLMGRFRVIIEGFETIPSNSNPKKPVEVIDTWTKESTVYASLSEAARAIGCVIQTVASALKKSPPWCSF